MAQLTPLTTPKPPVIMLEGYTSTRETSFTVECHDRVFNLVTTALDTPPSEPLFRAESKLGTSWSWRRKVYDQPAGAEQRHIFDFRHHSVDPKNRWLVEAADDKRQLAELVHRKQVTSVGHSDIDATVRTTAGEDVVVSMRRCGSEESAAFEDMSLSVGDTTFAHIQKIAYTPPVGLVGKVVGESIKSPSSVWKATVAEGVDMSLVMAMVLCRAEMCHVWKK